MFQSTHPHGVRLSRLRITPKTQSFNPRTRMGCDQDVSQYQTKDSLFQSTHPHGVRHKLAKESGASEGVSIHAPAWGATVAGLKTERTGVFQSTHPHGVRRKATEAKTVLRVFQSTHPHGVRHQTSLSGQFGTNVSIHAPAWGATVQSYRWYKHNQSFNPRTRMGCDERLAQKTVVQSVSIHAPAWGATCSFGRSNPRRHVSIHAPAWGATAQTVSTKQI